MWDGRRLDAFLVGEQPETWRDGVFWEFDFREPMKKTAETALGLASERCVLNVWRDERYKYVHFAGLDPLLFDLAADPGEFENLAGDPKMQGVAGAYAARLLDHRMVHADRTLTTTMLTDEGPVTDRTPRY
jgi:arylsulfatase A-like enzyme